MSDSVLELAYGRPSKAALYKVPRGKALIAIRFQVSVSGKPYLGRWSALVDLVNERDIQRSLRYNSKRISRLIYVLDLTAKEVAQALNILP